MLTGIIERGAVREVALQQHLLKLPAFGQLLFCGAIEPHLIGSVRFWDHIDVARGFLGTKDVRIRKMIKLIKNATLITRRKARNGEEANRRADLHLCTSR